MRPVIQRRFFGLLLLAACAACTSCTRLGWGVLLWSTEEPPIPSGTILPVRIRSNIDKVWVIVIPSIYRKGSGGLNDRMEIPLSRFELVGSKKKARLMAESFAPHALVYAENMQDGLPVRADPDNSARRLYRLRTGEVVKILAQVPGNPAISASGDPLPGEWYQVLTEDGTIGYCFSYRLKFFEYAGGKLDTTPAVMEIADADPDLDMLMSKVWSPESYARMIESRRINLDELSRRWRFEPGQDTGIAHIYLPGFDRIIPYTGIRPNGTRSWQFEGSNLQMSLLSDTTLAVQFTGSGNAGTLNFTALSADVDDLIMQENTRREGLYNTIYSQGPVFSSNNYGTIVFRGNGGFSWNGFELLVPDVIPAAAAGHGSVLMDIFLSGGMGDRYDGAFSLRFAGYDGREAGTVSFLYILDNHNQVFRLEAVPETSLDGITVTRRADSPVALYFYKDDSLATLLSRNQ